MLHEQYCIIMVLTHCPYSETDSAGFIHAEPRPIHYVIQLISVRTHSQNIYYHAKTVVGLHHSGPNPFSTSSQRDLKMSY